ncbi:MAG TPA: hypothetical protein VIF09_28860 [Polyangiaceae bacterium]|jgi:hypothetical protein
MRGPIRTALLPVLASSLFACESGPTTGPSPVAAASAPASASAPWPKPPAYDLAADLELRTAFAATHGAQSLLTDDVFLVASPDGDALPDDVKLVHDALAALLNGRFTRAPSRALTVYLFDDDRSFDPMCKQRFGDTRCASWLGLWIKETREIFADQGPGKSTLIHELTHPLLDADAEAVPGGRGAWRQPRWLREGVSSLFEAAVLKGTEIHGATNWRLGDLRRAQASAEDRELVHLDALFRMPDDLFDDSRAHDHARSAYAASRFACQYLDEQGKLWPFYRAWSTHAADDATGEKSFVETVGTTPKDADAAWQAWLGALHR